MGGGTEARNLRWYDLITINGYSLGFNIVSGTLTPVLLPYLVALIVPFEQKNTYLANIRVASLALAMFVQPVAGMLSDRCAHPLGRRRPYIIGGTLGTVLFLVPIGLAPQSGDAAYLTLLAGIVLVQGASNVALGAAQSLIPDLVPKKQRGRASGVKAVMELLPAFLIIPMGFMVDAGQTWLVLGIIGAVQIAAMAVTAVAVREVPLGTRLGNGLGDRLQRLVLLVLIFVVTTLGASRIVKLGGEWLAGKGASVAEQALLVGAAGLLGMVLSIVAGVYVAAWVGIGRDASRQRPFIWAVINWLFFLAAVGSIQGFAQYYLGEVQHVPNPAVATTGLLALVAAGVVTFVAVHEKRLAAGPKDGIGERLLRLAAQVALFVLITLLAAQLIKEGGAWLAATGASPAEQALQTGAAGLAGMVSIVAGAYLAVRVGLVSWDVNRKRSFIWWVIKPAMLRGIFGTLTHRQRSFIWWVINRLFFLAAIGSIQGFAQYYLGDVLHVPNPAAATTGLLSVVAVFLVASALSGGYLADRVGRKRLVGFSALAAAAGTGVLLLARDLPLVVVAASIIGAGTGISYASNWAMGTDLAPPEEAGRYLGIANLAGAGAGIVGVGIGGPLADFCNALRPGLGYSVAFALYGVLFLLSAAALTRIRE